MIDRDGSPQFLHPRHWKRAKGYANGVVAEGRTVFVAGQIGWNAAQKFESEDFVAQVSRALENVVAVVREAGGIPAHITRLTWYITDKKEYLSRLAEVGEAYRSVMGRHFPAMTMVQVTGLMEDQAKVEIEACAVLPNAEPSQPVR
jgi:enamine deaminase RidA (YjgF/YER057c/UK114 family)